MKRPPLHGSLERTEHERELLRLLVNGEKEIAIGKGYSLDSVLKDADSVLQTESC